MQTVNREKLIQELESVQAGLSVRAATEQSNCFVFDNGKVRTFNDEIACEQKTELGITGAIMATPFLTLLRKMPEEELTIDGGEDKLTIKGKRRRATLVFQQEVTLPFNEIGEPGKWKKLDKDFLEALTMTAECASDDQTMYVYTCVRIAPEYMEAMDMWQAGRFQIENPVKDPIFIRKTAAKHLAELDVTSISEGDSWLHFKDGKGLRMACRVSRGEEYPDIGKFMEMDGQKAKLPKGLVEATDRAEVFLDGSKDDKIVAVTIDGGEITIKGTGSFGSYRESRKISYKGPPLQFLISAKLLSHITSSFNECKIAPDRLLVEAGRFNWVTSLKDREAKKEKK